MKEVQIKIKGMVCGGCENRVKNALSTIDGITGVKANYKTGIVIINTDKEIEDKMDDLGFEIVKEG